VVKRYFQEKPAMVKIKKIEEKLKPILEKKEYWIAEQILRSRIKNWV
jgi:hypothetical protein